MRWHDDRGNRFASGIDRDHIPGMSGPIDDIDVVRPRTAGSQRKDHENNTNDASSHAAQRIMKARSFLYL